LSGDIGIDKRTRIVIDGPARTGETYVLQGDSLEAVRFREGRQGELVTLCDGREGEYRGRITSLVSDRATVYVFEKFRRHSELSWELVVCQALPDKERMELIIQKVTELGATIILPFKGGRSISLEEREARQAKAHRWQHIAVRATKQCRRARVPYVMPYCSFEAALATAASCRVRLLLVPHGAPELREVLERYSPADGVAVMAGPEGGWERTEEETAKGAGFTPVNMGSRILRTETATIAACAILQHTWGAA
jgi:16S rRNA (uracil1498-N3)-methyltransferase